jgi:hypothetical protein
VKKYILLICILLSFQFAMATTWFVSTIGSDSNTGNSVEQSFQTLDYAVKKIVAGDTILMRGGTYEHSTTVKLTTNANSNKKCYLMAYPGEIPVLDFSGTAFGKRGIEVTGSYWVIKGLNITLAGDNGMIITTGGYNLIENCAFFENKDTGLQMGGGTHDNQIINCDSYFNADPTDYGDADGFACKMDVGTNNYFYGCRSWVNVDDGWDGYLRGANDVTTILENCWTWGNGYMKDGTDPGSQANGNGFKMGGSDDKTLQHNFIVKNCLAFDNKVKGFDQNNNKGSMTIYNCTGFRNGGADFSIPGALTSGQTATVKNCILAKGKISLGTFVVQASNSWDSNFTVTDADFVSLDTTGVSGPRKADGSLPDIQFVHLAPGSDLIDAGIDLGLTYNGSKPDLGCFETEETNTTPLLKTKEENSLNIKLLNSNSSQLKIGFEPADTRDYSCELWNVTGTKVWSLHNRTTGTATETVHIETGHLPTGIYLFRLTSGNKYQTERIRIQ